MDTLKEEKILIIKTGYSEILDRQSNSRRVSLGDVLRTTVLLNLYKGKNVTWVTDEYAMPLLEGNPYITHLLPYDLTTILQLEVEEFDIVINLEKVAGLCALADKVKAWKKYGFRLNSRTGKAESYDKAFEVLTVSSDSKLKKENQRTSQELLFEMVGAKWNGEEYVLGYKPLTKENFDVALNIYVGKKWPSKVWAQESWDLLEAILKSRGFSVTRQDKQEPEVLENLNKYMDWLNSHKLIITSDSLGLHLALAMKKRVLGLFGPTPHKEVYFYNLGKEIIPEENFECLPCFSPKCENEKFCMNSISPQKVAEEAIKILSEYTKNKFCD